MATYCYTDETGSTEVHNFPMGKAPEQVVFTNGREAKRDMAAEWKPCKGRSCRDYRIECLASGVNPAQAPELRKFFKKHGESVEVTNDGNPVYTSSGQRKRLLKLRGFYDKNSFC